MEDVSEIKSSNADDLRLEENGKSSDGENSDNHDIGSADGIALSKPEANDSDQTLRKGCRVQLQNLPRYMGFKQFKTFLAKNVGKASVRKVRVTSDTAYFSLSTPEEALEAVRILNGRTIKKTNITAKIVNDEPPKGRDVQQCSVDESTSIVQKSAREIVTPYADMDYDEQLQHKMTSASRLAQSLINLMKSANVKEAYSMKASNLIQPIRRSPRIEGYRNKCEFTIGHDLDEAVCVGFVGGRFSASKHYVVPVDTCTNLSERVKNIVSEFQEFVAKSGEETFNEFTRVGVWRMLTIREFGNDIMLIVTVFPIEDVNRETVLKNNITEKFLRKEDLTDEENNLRVNSIYWQRLANASDACIYEHIAGSPYIYETILDTKFRISPGAFFQTNSYGAGVLYSTIAERAGLLNESGKIESICGEVDKDVNDCKDTSSRSNEVDSTNGKTNVKTDKFDSSNEAIPDEKNDVHDNDASKNDQTSDLGSSSSTTTQPVGTTPEDKKRSCEAHRDVCEEIAAKKPKIENDSEISDKASPEAKTTVSSSSEATVLLDVCCGTGTIGLCLMSLLRRSKRLSNHYLLGIEMIPEAVEDARVNAETNQFNKNECRFVAGKAEDVFRGLRLYVPSSVNLNEANVIGILDPPRAGIHEKVVVGCRTLSTLKRLIFVSCEPSQALKNLTDLCRPRSKKYAGEAFRLTSITPVDMFPQTKHCEWVIQLDR